MKGIQKNITCIIWACSVLITVLAIVCKYPMDTMIVIVAAMFGISMIATLLYYLPVNENAKAICVLLLIGFGCMAASIALGGNSGTYLVSFLVLGFAMLYFNPFVLGVYSTIYVLLSIAVCIVDPKYIAGKDRPTRISIFEIITYAIISVALYIGTKSGKRIMLEAEQIEKDAEEKSALIQELSDAASKNSSMLYEAIAVSDKTVIRLSSEAEKANKNILCLKESETETIRLFQGLYERIGQSTQRIEKNYQLIAELKENLRSALINVDESVEFSSNASRALAEIKTTIEHADSCIENSSKEVEKICKIINDIDEIASKTNLLAINASIEAARVGEKGKGFSIVADEVRTLSVQSKSASDNIRQILETLVKALAMTENKVNTGLIAIQQGITKLENMVSGIKTIDYYSKQSQETLNHEVDVFEKMKEEFSAMVHELEKTMDVSNKNMNEIEIVSAAVQSQSDRTIVIANQLKEMEQFVNQIRNEFEKI